MLEATLNTSSAQLTKPEWSPTSGLWAIALSANKSLTTAADQTRLRSSSPNSSIEVIPVPESVLNPPAFTCVVSPSFTGSIFEVALTRLQALNELKSSSAVDSNWSAVAATLDGVYALDAQGENRSAARGLLVFLEERLQRKNLAEANHLLAKVDVSHLSSRSMIGLVRSTYRAKRYLPAWEKAYEQSWHQVEKLGKSPESLFIGLPRPLVRDATEGSE